MRPISDTLSSFAPAGNKSSTADESSQPTSPGVEDETVVEPDQGNVLSHIISQLRPGADLSRVVLPTFILEPRSMLERITNIVTQPNMYARGILFGKMKYELGDHSYVRCPENNLVADVEFKTKGYFSGTYNAIGGSIKNEATGEIYYELSGFWNGEMYIKDVATKIEDRQREEAAQRADKGVEWRPRLFRRVKGGPGGPEEGEEDLDWILNAVIDSQDPKLATRQILAVAPILKGQVVNHQFDIPAHCPSSHHSSTPNSVTKEQPNNLIDLGNDGAADQRETTKNNGSGELVDLLSGSGNEGQKQISLTMNPLQPTISDQGHPTRRRDSESSGVDEFVDAQD
ncbi:oxysterol-binding protein [Coccidioides immitis RMSCC 3703]|uniref:Oxysterol-binding protein n=1 Tax=Coccidioides immitis RMSCC 3703 TaxID=454286 RepID=A0A0J8R4X0_COCIT|nr:oxysterol-binding protein [Coccidioides immitis RMSCC 3703]